jgi:tRNA(Phe) wybutosine-synthesizing methylase Tyw3
MIHPSICVYLHFQTHALTGQQASAVLKRCRREDSTAYCYSWHKNNNRLLWRWATQSGMLVVHAHQWAQCWRCTWTCRSCKLKESVLVSFEVVITINKHLNIEHQTSLYNDDYNRQFLNTHLWRSLQTIIDVRTANEHFTRTKWLAQQLYRSQQTRKREVITYKIVRSPSP